MKNISVKTIIAVITFVVGVAFVVFWFKLPDQIPIVSNIFTISDETDEYAIYSSVLNEIFAKDNEELLIISDKTSDKSSIKLKRKFTISPEYVFIEEAKYDNRILLDETDSEQKSAKPNISEFFKEHPKAVGIVKLSRIVFNENKTEAEVYVELTYCPLCGFGKGVALEKTNGSWKIKKITEGWVS